VGRGFKVRGVVSRLRKNEKRNDKDEVTLVCYSGFIPSTPEGLKAKEWQSPPHSPLPCGERIQGEGGS
jgi:hypothetical protein